MAYCGKTRGDAQWLAAKGSLKTACATIAAFHHLHKETNMKKWLLIMLAGLALAGCASSGDSDDLGIDPNTGVSAEHLTEFV